MTYAAQQSGEKRERAKKDKKKKDAAAAKKDTGVPKLGTLLTMPGLDSASVAAAEEASLRKQAKRGGRASTLLSDPNERPLAARDIATETVVAKAVDTRRTIDEVMGQISPEERARLLAEAKKKRVVAMGLYTTPTTVLGG